MTTTTKILVTAAATAALAAVGAAPASAHFVDVDNPQDTCRFLGGAGNPGHEGHGHGHVVAIAHEQSDAISIGGCD